MLADADLAALGAVIGDAHRARFLLALLGGQELTAGEIARRSGASSSLASAHLKKLLDAGLITVERQGRQRRYRLAGGEVAQALERLLAIAPSRAAGNLRESVRGEAIKRARTCYDHLAGRLGVALVDAMENHRLLVPAGDGWELTKQGEDRLDELGVEFPVRRSRRPLIRPCLHWTERRPHMAGALGAAIAGQMFDAGWIERLPGSRALRVTAHGERQLLGEFGLYV